LSFKKGIVEFLRLLGWPTPSKIAILNDSDLGKKLILENFKINFGARRHYKKNGELIEAEEPEKQKEPKKNEKTADKDKDKPLDGDEAKEKEKKQKTNLQKLKSMNLEPSEEIKDLIDDLDIDKGLSTITDLNTFEEYFIAGKAENMSRMRNPSELFWTARISAVLPIALLLEVWNIFLIYDIPYDPVIAAIVATFFASLSLHNYRYAYRTKIDALIATRRGTLGGVPTFVPNLKEFMNFKQTRNVELLHDGITALTAENKPLKMENDKLTRTLDNVYDGYKRSWVEGKREGLLIKAGGVKQHLGLFSIFAIFVAGILIGWLISNGFGFAAVPSTTNSTLTNSTLALIGG
jgi:cell division protein FtsB